METKFKFIYSFVTVAVRQQFSHENGFIIGFSIIVCEINPWVDRHAYDANMPVNMPTHMEVSPEIQLLTFIIS